MTKALEHLKVLDLSRVLAGPWSTQILADLGAEVIKIERRLTGDDTRGWGPPFLRDAQGEEDPLSSAYFVCTNRGKRSVTVDISDPRGQEIVRGLAATADILVENYKVGDMAKYGLDYESLKRLNPRLIYCSITGYGQTGPSAGLPGYDYVFQGLSGLMSVTGQPDGAPGGEPMKSGVAITDIITGMYATVAILAAIEHRNISGCGQYIDMSLLDCATAILSNQAENYLLSGDTPKRLGNAHPNMVPYQVFRCREGELIVAVGNDGQFRALANLLEMAGLSDDDRFRTVADRNRNRSLLVPIISEALRARPAHEWASLMNSLNIPCGPINTVKDVFEDPQVVHRGLLQHVGRAEGDPVPIVANPIRLSATPIVHDAPPPRLGEHTDEVLADALGLDAESIETLRRTRVI